MSKPPTMSPSSSSADSDADSDTTEISNSDAVGFSQAEIDAAMTLLDLRGTPQPEVEGQRWTSNVPAAMQAAQPLGAQVQVMRWGAPSLKQAETVTAETVKDGLTKRVMPHRVVKGRHRPALKLDIPKPSVKNGVVKKDARGRNPRKIAPKQSSNDSFSNTQSSPYAMCAVASTPDQQSQNGNEASSATPTNGEATTAQLISNPLSALDADGLTVGLLPSEKNLVVTLHNCGDVSICFSNVDHGVLLVSRDQPCALLRCQTTYPQHTFQRTWHQINNASAQKGELDQYRAELGVLNAVACQSLFRLEFASTGRLEPGMWLEDTRDKVLKRDMKLPVIAALVDLIQVQTNVWYRHSYLQATRILLEQAQLPFKHFVNWVDEMCEGVEKHLAVGRLTAAEIDRLGAIVPVASGQD